MSDDTKPPKQNLNSPHLPALTKATTDAVDPESLKETKALIGRATARATRLSVPTIVRPTGNAAGPSDTPR